MAYSLTKYFVVIVCALLLPALSYGYRFTCNSIDAEGSIFPDECGICSADTAARWDPSVVKVETDFSRLPANISPDQWVLLLEESLAKWSDFPGSRLQLSLNQQSTSRSFGTESSHRSIFWITDVGEWRRRVGGGETSTLGLTLAPYTCPDSGTPFRGIVDADVVLNGTGTFKWEGSCSRIDSSCSSIRNTLVHELGHLIGLGHPRVSGDSSIMCAEAGANLEYPQSDDYAGLLALYPQVIGESGSTCRVNEECNDGLICTIQGMNSYCSLPCQKDRDCPERYTCGFTNPRACHLVDEKMPKFGRAGAACHSIRCQEGLVCAGFENNYFCFDRCSRDGRCHQNNQVCKALEGSTGVCLAVSQVGEQCGQTTLCPDQHLCVRNNENGVGLCRNICDPNRVASCPAKQYCAIFQDRGICLPFGEKLELVRSLDANSPPDSGIEGRDNLGCACSTLEAQGSGLQLYILGALWLKYVGLRVRKNRAPK